MDLLDEYRVLPFDIITHFLHCCISEPLDAAFHLTQVQFAVLGVTPSILCSVYALQIVDSRAFRFIFLHPPCVSILAQINVIAFIHTQLHLLNQLLAECFAMFAVLLLEFLPGKLEMLIHVVLQNFESCHLKDKIWKRLYHLKLSSYSIITKTVRLLSTIDHNHRPITFVSTNDRLIHVLAVPTFAFRAAPHSLLSALTVVLLAFRFFASTALKFLGFHVLRLGVLIAAVGTATLSCALPSLAKAQAIASHALAIRAVALNILSRFILGDWFVQKVVNLPTALL